jgi:G:T-mismatch repair DNA endonuclease (very short patch repair protein)
MGWRVLRLWESDVKRQLPRAAARVHRVVLRRLAVETATKRQSGKSTNPGS